MKKEIILSKGVIIKRIQLGAYQIKDIITNKELPIVLSGKERINYIYEIGDEVYYAIYTKSELKPKRGKLMTPTGFKYNQDIYSLKKEFDKKYSEYITNKKNK